MEKGNIMPELYVKMLYLYIVTKINWLYFIMTIHLDTHLIMILYITDYLLQKDKLDTYVIMILYITDYLL